MPSLPVEFSRRTARWLLPAAALALAPKCVLCVIGYAGLGAALGLGGAEICGGPTEPAGRALPFGIWIGSSDAKLIASRDVVSDRLAREPNGLTSRLREPGGGRAGATEKIRAGTPDRSP